MGFGGSPFSLFPDSAQRETVEASPRNTRASRSIIFSAADRPSRSRSDAAMTVTPGTPAPGPGRAAVAPGLTSPRRAHHRPRPAPWAESTNHRQAEGRDGAGPRPGGCRRIPAPLAAPQATPPGGAANPRRGGAGRGGGGVGWGGLGCGLYRSTPELQVFLAGGISCATSSSQQKP